MSTTLDHLDTKVSSSQSRRDQLEEITDRYFRGEMETEDFIRYQRALSPDYRAAFHAVARLQIEIERSNQSKLRRAVRRALGLT